MGYGFGSGSLWSLAVLVHRLAEPSPFALTSSVGTSAMAGAFITSSTTSGEGDRLRRQVVAKGVANSSTRPFHVLRLGMGRAQCAIAITPQQRLCPSGGYASEEPGTVATAAGRTVATSEGGGRPCRQSRPLWRGLFIAYTQHKQSEISISSRSCCPWRWWAQVTASQRLLARR